MLWDWTKNDCTMTKQFKVGVHIIGPSSTDLDSMIIEIGRSRAKYQQEYTS